MTAQQNEPANDTDSDQEHDEEQKTTEKPEVTEEHREKARELMKSYEDRPTAVMPGTHNTITGTAVNEWLDDEGNPKYGEAEDFPEVESEGRDQETAHEK